MHEGVQYLSLNEVTVLASEEHEHEVWHDYRKGIKESDNVTALHRSVSRA
jgi:hypothetical protein